jgi:hypothetical protein
MASPVGDVLDLAQARGQVTGLKKSRQYGIFVYTRK